MTLNDQRHLKHLARAIAEFNPPFQVVKPRRSATPFVFCSPHSGRHYPAAFVKASNLDPLTLRRSEDSFVEEIFSGASSAGASLLHAHFPRAYLDPNREPYELDPAMFTEPLPPHVNTRSLRVAGGLGTIARIVTESAEIYRSPLPYAEAERRIEKLYIPFHETLQQLLQAAHQRFGYAILIDCHSMPSIGGPMDDDVGADRPDIILGDRYGTTCAPVLIDEAERYLATAGYHVVRNKPYAGGFNTEHYGQPSQGLHALQIEINRALYMNEAKLRRLPTIKRLTRNMTALAQHLGKLDARELGTPAQRAAE